MGRRPLPALRDFTRDGRWSAYDVSVCRKMAAMTATATTVAEAAADGRTTEAGGLAASAAIELNLPAGITIKKMSLLHLKALYCKIKLLFFFIIIGFFFFECCNRNI